jgi:hypothetical protein
MISFILFLFTPQHQSGSINSKKIAKKFQLKVLPLLLSAKVMVFACWDYV